MCFSINRWGKIAEKCGVLYRFVVREKQSIRPPALFLFTYVCWNVTQATGFGVTLSMAWMTVTTEVDMIIKT